jgi:hypothetical protein
MKRFAAAAPMHDVAGHFLALAWAPALDIDRQPRMIQIDTGIASIRRIQPFSAGGAWRREDEAGF